MDFETGDPAVCSVRGILEKTADDRRRHHVADVFAFSGLKRHPDQPPVLDHGAAAVSRIDGRVDLAAEKFDHAVRIIILFDPRDDAHSHRHLLSSLGESVDRNLVLRPDQIAQGNRHGSGKEAVVFDRQNGQVAFMGYDLDAGRIFLGRPGSFDLDELRVGVCLAMAGAVLGFLPYNIPPASIFMGDAGSMLLGGYVATMMALFCVGGNPRWLAAACMVFALPILDTALAVVRRFRAGVNIFAGDRSHLYDQLVDRGMSVKQVVVLFYGLAMVTAAIGVGGAILLRMRYALPLYAALLILAWGVFLKLGMVTPPVRRPTERASNGRDAEMTE